MSKSSEQAGSLHMTSLLQQFEASWVRAVSAGRWSITRDNAQDIETALVQGGQLGLFNINYGKSEDPELERLITTQVAGYGRQLGRLLEAVDVLVRHAPPGLSTREVEALRALDELAEEVAEVKREASRDDAAQTAKQVRKLCADPTRNREVLDEIRSLLATPPSTDSGVGDKSMALTPDAEHRQPG